MGGRIPRECGGRGSYLARHGYFTPFAPEFVE